MPPVKFSLADDAELEPGLFLFVARARVSRLSLVVTARLRAAIATSQLGYQLVEPGDRERAEEEQVARLA